MRNYKRWTRRELLYLKENYLKQTSRELGKALGRTPYSIRNKLWRLGLYQEENLGYKNTDFGTMSIEEIKKLIEDDLAGR